MTETSYPYDTSQILTELQWSSMAGNFQLDGVIGTPTSTVLKATSSGMTVSVPTGPAFVNGFYYNNDAVKNFTVPANGGGSTRYDRVVIRSNQTTNNTLTTYVNGGTSPPAFLTDRNDKFDVGCVKVAVAPGATAVTLTDERTFTGNQVATGSPDLRLPAEGMILVDQASTGYPKVYVGSGASWVQVIPGNPWLVSKLPSAKTNFGTSNSWQDVDTWPALTVPGLTSGEQIEISLFVGLKAEVLSVGSVGASWRVSGVGIGESDYSQEILLVPSEAQVGFTFHHQISLPFDVVSTGTAVINARARTGSGGGTIVRGKLSARIVR